jgi:acetylornithine deacetylase/succinyl-diaminopimelate desuccinylase-like protein
VGIPAYGVNGAFGELDSGNAHGANERLPVDSYYEGIEFLYRLVKTLTASGLAQNP